MKQLVYLFMNDCSVFRPEPLPILRYSFMLVLYFSSLAFFILGGT